jgi:hypothetical protein
VVAGGALGLDETGVADDRIGAGDHFGFDVLGLAPPQGLPLWAAVLIVLGIVGELG